MLLDTPVCNFGWKALDFKLPAADGQSHKRDSLVGTNGLLVAFICNHCPYVKAIVQNFVLDTQKLEHLGINTVAIMPNDFVSHPADSPKKMLDFAKKLTINSHEIDDHDRNKLRRVKFNEYQILEIIEVASFFNMTNRIASGTNMLPNEEYYD